MVTRHRFKTGGQARPIEKSTLVGGRGQWLHCLPQAPGHSRGAPGWRRGSGYPVRDDPISDPLGELHHAQSMGSGRLRSPCAQSESAALRELA